MNNDPFRVWNRGGNNCPSTRIRFETHFFIIAPERCLPVSFCSFTSLSFQFEKRPRRTRVMISQERKALSESIITDLKLNGSFARWKNSLIESLRDTVCFSSLFTKVMSRTMSTLLKKIFFVKSRLLLLRHPFRRIIMKHPIGAQQWTSSD